MMTIKNVHDVEWKKWGKNTALFLAPALLVFLYQIQDGKTLDEAFVALQVWALSTAIDLTKKFIAQG